MGTAKQAIEQVKDELAPAHVGAGPLLQRDYWAVLDGCPLAAAEVAAAVRARFLDFPPPELVGFRRVDGDGPLEVGDELEVEIHPGVETAVRVIHADDHSLTLGTVAGHPEAGRITFGAYPNARGDVVFHIRSRARAGSSTHYTGFLAIGEAMQTNTWTDFIDRLAHSIAEGVVGAIRADTQEVEEDDADREMDAPTFVAREA
ncbi:MAG: DUF1990 family protein [Rhodothermales bacterium]|nr:DUF1990 family protein [Rhodothermales bacterium]